MRRSAAALGPPRHNAPRHGGRAPSAREARDKFAIPPLPWHVVGGGQQPRFLLDAEARWGPKETWADAVTDRVKRRELLGILVDHVELTLRSVTRLQGRETSERSRALLRHADTAYWLRLAQTEPSRVREWPRPQNTQGNAEESFATDAGAAADVVRSFQQREAAEAEDVLAVQRASNQDTTHLDDRMDDAAAYSALPFLRDRVDAAPDTVESTLRHAVRAQPLSDELGAAPKAAAEHGAALPLASADLAQGQRRRAPRPEEQLRRPLRKHLTKSRPTFDAEGVFFAVRPNATRLREVRPSLLREGATDVVKVDWPTVRAAMRGKGIARAKARERMLRLCRGEDPETMPL